MNELVLNLSTALLCSALQCWPVLIGQSTPTGTFSLEQRLTDDLGYGGDILQFAEYPNYVFAIHRVWLLSPKQHRDKRLLSKNPKDRIITAGCINVDPEVYDTLVTEFSDATLRIER